MMGKWSSCFRLDYFSVEMSPNQLFLYIERYGIMLPYYNEFYNKEGPISQILVSLSDIFNNILSSVDKHVLILEIY